MPIYLLKTPKIKILKNEKISWRYHHFINVYQKSQSYDVQFLRYGVRLLSFWAIFCPFTPSTNYLENQNFEKKMKKMPRYIILLYIQLYHKWRSYDIGSWNLTCHRQKFLLFSAIFCIFSPLTTWKIKILKFKKTPGDIIILQICTINDNYMMYCSWDMEHNRHNFLWFWIVFCPLTPWVYHHFTQVYHK